MPGFPRAEELEGKAQEYIKTLAELEAGGGKVSDQVGARPARTADAATVGPKDELPSLGRALSLAQTILAKPLGWSREPLPE
jgi:hypothetical protein